MDNNGGQNYQKGIQSFSKVLKAISNLTETQPEAVLEFVNSTAEQMPKQKAKPLSEYFCEKVTRS